MMNAFLQAVGWAYPLAPKLTTIGRSGCDIIINSPSVDRQHAVIEYSPSNQTVTIRDLSTEKGTYVNNLPIRNSLVKLKSGDQLRFGCEPTVYEFHVSTEVESSAPDKPQKAVSVGVPSWIQVNACDPRLLHSDICQNTKPTETADSTITTPNSLHPDQGIKSSVGSPIKEFSETPLILEGIQQAGNSREHVDGNISAGVKQLANAEDKGGIIKRLQEEVSRLAPLEAMNAQKDMLIRHVQQQLVQLAAHQSCTSARNETSRLMRTPEIVVECPTEQYNSSLSPSRTRPVSASSVLHLSLVNDPNSPFENTQPDANPKEPMDLAVLERLRRERQILSGLVTQLQRDLSTKDTNMGRLTQEINTLRRQLDEKDTTLNALHTKHSKSQSTAKIQMERDEHERQLAAIRQKYKTAELNSQALTEELDKVKRERDTVSIALEESQATEKRIRKQVEELQTQITQLNRSHKTTSLEKEEISSQYERLRNRLIRTIFSALAQHNPDDSGCRGLLIAADSDQHEVDTAEAVEVYQNPTTDTSNNAMTNETDDSHILDRLQFLIEDYLKLHRQRLEKSNDSKLQAKRDQGVEKALDAFIDELSEIQERSNDNSRLRPSIRLRNQLDLLATHTPKSKSLKRLQDVLSNDWQQQMVDIQRIEDCLEEACRALSLQCSDPPVSMTPRPDDVVSSIRRLAEFGMAVHAKWEQLQIQLREQAEHHLEQLARVKELSKKEQQQRIEEALEKNNEEHDLKLRQSINEVVRIENERQEQLIKVKQAIIEELEKKMRETRQVMAERQTAYESDLQELHNKVGEMQQLKQNFATREAAYAALTEQLEDARQAVDRTRKETETQCEERWRKEVELHREQAKQHARTICVMEERLVKLAKQAKESKAEVTRLKRQNTVQQTLDDLQTEHKQLQLRLTEAQQKLLSARRASPPSTEVREKVGNSAINIGLSQSQTDALKCEVLGLKGLLHERDMTVEMLRADLEGARAQLSDLRGELTEAQKEEIESVLDFGKKANAELASTRARLSQLNDIVTGLRKQLSDKEEALRKQVAQTDELRSTLDKRQHESERLSRLINEEREVHARDLDKLQTASRLTEELAAVGGECRGERHLEIIEKQREALSQLRQRLREHTAFGDAVLPGEQNRQIINLRREVAELRSQTLLSEVLPALQGSGGHQAALESGSHPADTDSGVDTPLMDRTSLRSAMDALHRSEECYLDLSRAIARQLNVDKLPGQRSMVYIPNAERELVRRERASALELLSKRIAVLRDQVQRKEEMLMNYEQDVGMRKQAEALVEAKSEQMERLLAELRSKNTEIQLLRQSLDRAREELVNEQRTVSAIRKSKHIMTTPSVGAKRAGNRQKETHCQNGDSNTKEARQIQEMLEKVKRKDYEIMVLKSELSDREKRLKDTTQQFNQMKTSMGLKTDNQ